jgi:hypothetical protein
MSKITAVLGSALVFVVAPAMVAGLIPWLITHWEFRPPFLAVEATRLAGVAFIIAGVPGLLDSFARFALEGLGTPAPIAPTRILVVSGLYRMCAIRCMLQSLPSFLVRRCYSLTGVSSATAR